MSDEYLWEDECGTWAQDVADPSRFRLVRGPDKRAVSGKIDQRDLWHLVGASAIGGTSAGAREMPFPRSFRFHPMTGQALEVPVGRAPRAWVPPFGSPGPDVMPRGVRRTVDPLRVVAGVSSRADVRGNASGRRPDVKLPGPGKYEFIVGRFGAWADSLLAMDRVQGFLYVWMAVSEKWVQLSMPPGMPNLDSAINGDRWGMELLQSTVDHRGTAEVYVPAYDGLAMLEPRVLSLDCTVKMVCRGSLCGAPAAWEDAVWVPVAGGATEGRARDQSRMTVFNHHGDHLTVEDAPGAVQLRPPASCARQVVWPAMEGQLVLSRSDGRPKAQWLPWPSGFVPRFEYGAPYVDRGASVWQLGWVEATGRFEYVTIGTPKPLARPVDGWRFNTQSVVYYRLTRWRHDPWNPVTLPPGQEPGPDFAVPMIESEQENGCICLRFHPTTASESPRETFDRRGKIRAELFYEDDDETRIEIDSLEVVEPWLTRLIVHDAMLWMYHPDLEMLRRWDLQASAAGLTSA